jgi:hypothetical protein
MIARSEVMRFCFVEGSKEGRVNVAETEVISRTERERDHGRSVSFCAMIGVDHVCDCPPTCCLPTSVPEPRDMFTLFT